MRHETLAACNLHFVMKILRSYGLDAEGSQLARQDEVLRFCTECDLQNACEASSEYGSTVASNANSNDTSTKSCQHAPPCCRHRRRRRHSRHSRHSRRRS
eukprot:4121248-Pleurochrysis_carterae.AAC.1